MAYGKSASTQRDRNKKTLLASLAGLEEERPKIICIDELEKMGRQFQNHLLNFIESGRIKVDQMRRQYDFEIKGAKVFVTCNEINRLSKPLQSRFRRLFLPRYTEQQFIDVSVKVLRNVSDSMAQYIGFTVFKNGGDIRDVISIGKLVRKSDSPIEVEMINTMRKYGAEHEWRGETNGSHDSVSDGNSDSNSGAGGQV
jgi:replication-associated recombination protein RarA